MPKKKPTLKGGKSEEVTDADMREKQRLLAVEAASGINSPLYTEPEHEDDKKGKQKSVGFKEELEFREAPDLGSMSPAAQEQWETNSDDIYADSSPPKPVPNPGLGWGANAGRWGPESTSQSYSNMGTEAANAANRSHHAPGSDGRAGWGGNSEGSYDGEQPWEEARGTPTWHPPTSSRTAVQTSVPPLKSAWKSWGEEAKKIPKAPTMERSPLTKANSTSGARQLLSPEQHSQILNSLLSNPPHSSAAQFAAQSFGQKTASHSTKPSQLHIPAKQSNSATKGSKQRQTYHGGWGGEEEDSDSDSSHRRVHFGPKSKGEVDPWSQPPPKPTGEGWSSSSQAAGLWGQSTSNHGDAWGTGSSWGVGTSKANPGKGGNAYNSPPPKMASAISSTDPHPYYNMPSRTLTHASRGETTPVYPGLRNLMNDYVNVRFIESFGEALDPVQKALFGKQRLARDRLHWMFPADKDERVSTLTDWINAMSYNLSAFGLHKFLQTRERGALFTNADYRPASSSEPAFEWLTFDDLQPTMDQILQESVVCYDPAIQVIVFIVLPSKSGNSAAIWRRKLTIPNNLRLAFQSEISLALAGLRKDKDYVVHIDEVPPSSTRSEFVEIRHESANPTPRSSPIKRSLSASNSSSEPPMVPAKPKKRRKWWKLFRR